jgi:hypothetical protein
MNLMQSVVAAAEKEQGRHLTAEEVRALIEKEWNAQNATFETISRDGMQKYYDSRPDKKDAFFTVEQIKKGNGACACCSDEGCRKYTNGTGEKMKLIRTPGSGILDAIDLKDKDPFNAAFIDKNARAALMRGATVFSYHENCGAAKGVFEARIAWLKENGKAKEAAALEAEGPLAFNKRWAEEVTARMREIAAELKLPHATRIKTGFISKEMMDRPPEIHRARILYVTDDDEFDASYKGLPQGFVEGTGGPEGDLKTVLSHVDILRRIGFSEDHGFGTKFSEKPSEQFVICCMAQSQERLDVIMAHARQQVATLTDKLEGEALEQAKAVQKKIRIDGFVH